ncbi:hypothetical protein MBLNU13_g04944t1 [Cladosporium sp. NU13]
MCHGRFTGNLARFAARSFPDHFLRLMTDISSPPGNYDLLYAANTPLLPGPDRYYHLDGSRDDSREIAFLASDGRRSHLLGIPLGLADPETQHDIVSVSLLRRRIWLNGGRGEGQDDDFRFVVDGRGTWIVRLRSGHTPPDSAGCSTIDEEEEEEDQEYGEEEYTNLLDIPDVPPPWDFQPSQFGALQLTRRQRRNQRRRVANTRLYDITTRINILRGIPHAATRLPSRFISSLDDVQNLADQLRSMPRHIVSEETFGMFDRALDQLERTASLATLASRRRSAAAEDFPAEVDQPTHPLDSADSASTPREQSTSPPQPFYSTPAEDPALTTLRTRRDHLATLNTIISSLATLLSSPHPPTRSTFSPLRRAFDKITTLISQQASDSNHPPDDTILDSVSAAQSLFWMLARRAFPGAQSAGMPIGATPVRGRSRFRSGVPAARRALRRGRRECKRDWKREMGR